MILKNLIFQEGFSVFQLRPISYLEHWIFITLVIHLISRINDFDEDNEDKSNHLCRGVEIISGISSFISGNF